MYISLAQQSAGPNVWESVNAAVLSLRRLLARLCVDDYISGLKEIALILRVDGALYSFKFKGPEPPKFRRDYVQVDIGIPEDTWQVPDREFRLTLLDFVDAALASAIDRAAAKGKNVKKEALAADYGMVRSAFLEQVT